MADTAAFFISTTGGPLVSSVDPLNFTATFAPMVTVADLVPPTATAVTVISYPVERSDPLVLQIDDLILIKNLMVNVKYATSDWETAYDGALFAPRYLTAATGPSTLAKPSDTQWILTLRRAGGWPYPPIANIRAIDGAGNMS